MAEKAGRPRVLVRRHVLEIKEDTRDWIEEKILPLVLQVPVVKAVGESLRGALSHPTGYLSVVGAIILAAHTIPGLREIIVGLETAAAEAVGRSVETFVRDSWRAVSEASEARSEEERQMYEEWIAALWRAIEPAFQPRGLVP